MEKSITRFRRWWKSGHIGNLISHGPSGGTNAILIVHQNLVPFSKFTACRTNLSLKVGKKHSELVFLLVRVTLVQRGNIADVKM